VVQLLEGLLPVARKDKSDKVERGKKQKKTQDIINPQDQGDGEIHPCAS
jgi:hypothetical protein